MNYGPASKYYDLFAAKDDINFYKELALKHGRKALELGVGTGRVAIELAKADVNMWGIDNSKYMLGVARQKLRSSATAVRKRVVLKHGDMRNFKLKERFPFVYIPSATFEHCLTQEDQTKCLTSVLNILERPGVFAFDLSQPPLGKPESSWWIERRELSPGREVIRTIFSKRDSQTNIVMVQLFFGVYHEGRVEERFYEQGEAKISTKIEIEKLLKDVGFNIDSIYGSFNKTAHSSESKNLIFVASTS
ncbi:MAG: class I SAM-dependent methyltransferase [Candidatus Bathyarchaeota archaeon]|nr:MAG: class I SAM-dependent methyltransferase [Candidatus Bathyarchaeota archaeon]